MQSFTPFPLRARNNVEIFDAAIKLYKQYFWVLFGWSALVAGSSLLGAIIPMGGIASMFVTPLAIGSCLCCVAAAVRGQSVEFKQCWKFTSVRYWPLLGMHLLASLIGSILVAIAFGIIVAIVIGGVYLFRSSPGGVQLGMGLLGFLVFGTIATIVLTVFVSWMGLVPIVVGMEENNRNANALGRAYELLRGHWWRITTLMGLAGLGALALLAMIGGAAALLVGVGRITQMAKGGGNEAGMIALIAGMGLSYTTLWMLWTPLYYLILVVFYLDVRVRDEALDLEWTAHTTAPPLAQNIEAYPSSTPAEVPSTLEREFVAPQSTPSPTAAAFAQAETEQVETEQVETETENMIEPTPSVRTQRLDSEDNEPMSTPSPESAPKELNKSDSTT